MWQRSDYLKIRRRFEPKIVRLVIVAESPPASGKYFYNPSGATSEPLFAALMQEIGFSPTSKESGLREFQTTGWVLVDATYTPVNGLSDTERDKVIVGDYQSLHADLTALLPDKATPLILIKANVCRLLEHQLDADGFRVLNNGRVVYFPSTGRQQEFHLQFNQIVESARVSEIPAHFKKIPESARVKQILESARPREQPLPRWRRFLPERDQVLTALKWVGRGLRTVVAKRIEEMPEQPHRGYGGARGMGAGYEQCAPEIAARYGLDEKRYRHALREQARYDPHLSGHAHGARWCAPIGSPMHDAMIKVAERLTKNTP